MHRRAGELAWSELTRELAVRETAIRWLAITGAWGRPPTRIGLDPTLPPARALEDLLDQIDAGELDVSPEQRAAAARIAEAYTDATYAPPLPAAADDTTTTDTATPTTPTTARPLHSGRNETPITPSTQRSSDPATGTHPLRHDADQIVELIRTAR